MRALLKSTIFVAILIAIALLNIQMVSAPTWSKSFDSTTKTLSLMRNSDVVATVKQESDISGITTKEEVFNLTFYGWTGVNSYTFNDGFDFNMRWNKYLGTENITGYDLFLQRNISYNLSITDYGWNNHTEWYNRTTVDNVTNITSWINETILMNESVIIGTHTELRYKLDWVPLTLSGKTIYAGQSYIIKVVFYKKAEVGNFALKTIPTFIYGVEDDRMTWWNTSRNYSAHSGITGNGTVLNLTITNLSCISDATRYCANSTFNRNFTGINVTWDNTTEVPYYINFNSSSDINNATLFINLSGVPTDKMINIYHGVGNLGTEVGTASNENTTFPYATFGCNLGKLTITGTVGCENGQVKITGGGGWNTGGVVGNIGFMKPFELNWKSKGELSTTNFAEGIAPIDALNLNVMFGIMRDDGGDGKGVWRRLNTSNSGDLANWDAGIVYDNMMTVNSSGNYNLFINGTSLDTGTFTANGWSFLAQVYQSGQSAWYDEIYVRPRPDTMPTWLGWGQAESQSVVDTTSPVSITGLTNTTGNFYHNWTWVNPSDTDFNHTMIYINGNFVTNVSNTTTFYNFTANAHNTSTISTHTVDNSSNVNSTWVNHTSAIPNNPITISGVLSSYSLNEGQSLSIDANYTDADSDVGVFSTNATKGSINSATGVYTLNAVDGDQGIYNWNISVTDNNGSTSIVNFTVTINYQLVPATEPSGVYAFRNSSIPSNATILNYKNNSILTTVITLDWDNISSGDWNTTKGGINYSYTNGMRTALRLNLGGDYTNTGVQNNTKNNITTYFPDLTSDPFQSDVQWIELNFTNSTAASADKRTYANLTAKNISEKSANKFPVYTVESITGLDGDYVKSSPLIYLNITNNSDFISKESVTTRGNTTLSRVYSGNESVLPLISYYKTGVLNKLRGTISTTHPAESYATYVNNGSSGLDLILYNNLSTIQNRTVANQIGTFLDSNNDIMRKLVSSGTLYFNVSAENFTYILNESISKIILNDTAHQVYGASNTFNGTFTHGTNYTNQVHIFAGTNTDIKSELFDPSNIKTTLTMIHYEWINASVLSNYSGYKYVIVADKNAGEINGTINRSDAIYVYYAVNDYVDNGNTWIQAKKDEVAWALARGYNIFLDGIDSEVTANNFSTGFKSVVDNITINNSKSVICNTYTAYQTFATYCNAVMKESAFSRWDGSVSSPTYSWEDMTLEKQRADYYSSHNLPVIAMAFGDVTDYQKQTFGYYATAVLYGFNGNNSYRYGQPNFQSQKEYTVPDFGTMLETGYTETSSTDWNRLYSKGRVHINPVAHTYWIDDAKVVNEMYLELYLYKASEGTGDLNLSVTINQPNGTMYNISASEFNNASVGSWQYKKISIPTSEYKDYGIYPIYAATRPNTGGWQIGLDVTGNNKSGLHSWYDTTGTNINTTGNDSVFTWGGWARDQNYIMKLTVNYTTLLQVDTLATSTISQTDSRTSGNRTVTITSSNEYNTSIFSIAKQLITTTISSVWFKNSTGFWISANVPGTNASDINATNPSWTETTIDGLTYGAIKQYISANLWWIKFLFPHLSTQEAMVGENVAPTISNVTSQTVNENNTVYVDIDGSDANGDTLTFSTNRSDLFADFNSTTGKGNWTTNFSSAGTYYVDFGVSDGINNTNGTMIITITNIPLSITAFLPSSDPSVAQNTAQAFNITLNRSANVTWLVNGTQAHVNTSVTIANYTNNGSTAGNFNITVSATDGVDTVSRMWNLTVTAPAQESTGSTTTRTSGTSGGYTPEGLEELEESRSLGRKDYSFRIIFDGSDGQVEPLKSSEHGITALNLFFKTPVKGTYTFILSTYTDYKPRQNGSLKYFSISPTFDLKPTSSIEITSEEAIELYQLYNTTWKKLQKGTKVSKDKYRFPVTSFGVFAVMPEGKQEIKANIVQPKESILDFNFNASQVFKNIQERDRDAYETLKVKLAWLVEAIDKVKALISEKLNTLL